MSSKGLGSPTKIGWDIYRFVFEHFKSLKSTLAKHDNVSKKKNFEIRNSMTYTGCASQKCFNLVDRKSFDFFAEHAGKIPSISPFYPWNCRFREWCFASFVPIFGRPPSSARIPTKIDSEMIISKFWIKKLTRIFPSENDSMKKCSSKNALLPVKLPCVLLCFIKPILGKSLCTVPGLHRERAKGDAPTIWDRRRPYLTLSPLR